MDLVRELTERGFVYQHTGESLTDIFGKGQTRTVYFGVDATADSMHVGHLVPFIMLNHILRAGHKVIFLFGGGTALIGDPSFREQERDIADIETIKRQCDGLEAGVRSLTHGENIEFVNNYDWLSQLTAIEFLRDVGKHFTVNGMVKKESVARRFESEHGISYTEFSYSLLQAYDYYHLHQKYGCDVQIGGSDQWGNVIAGVDLIRRKTGEEVHALTMQLITDRATGKKFGKSEGNAVWLSAEKTPPYTFYQWWLNTNDESVIDFLKLFTFRSLEEIAEIETAFQADPASRSAQQILAHEVTSFVHGEAAANAAARVSQVLFGGGSLLDLDESETDVLLNEAPVVEVSFSDPVVEVLVRAGLATSKREARTFIESGAITLADERVTNVTATVGDMTNGALALLRRGKRHVVVVKVV